MFLDLLGRRPPGRRQRPIVDWRNSRVANRASQGDAWPTIALLAWRSDRDDGTTREIRARKYRCVLTAIAGIFRVTSEPCVFSRGVKRMSTTVADGGPLISNVVRAPEFDTVMTH